MLDKPATPSSTAERRHRTNSLPGRLGAPASSKTGKLAARRGTLVKKCEIGRTGGTSLPYGDGFRTRPNLAQRGLLPAHEQLGVKCYLRSRPAAASAVH